MINSSHESLAFPNTFRRHFSLSLSFPRIYLLAKGAFKVELTRNYLEFKNSRAILSLLNRSNNLTVGLNVFALSEMIRVGVFLLAHIRFKQLTKVDVSRF